ncbi:MULTISPECIES: preQ(1) synthase [unclassified Campylobacter]|uniref:preQ(1) synthase n=1 Tax=unclassified Campylobacter TaxID=2593542 RepID=UPI003D34006E
MSKEILILDDEQEQDVKPDLKYGEQIFKNFNPETDLEFWENKHEREYMISITLPEFCCLCPRSGYPDFATIYVDYIPNKFVVELKTIKLYINSFMNRNISHEDSINEIYDLLYRKLEPRYMRIVGDFNPRGNVHTVIEISSESLIKKQGKNNADDEKSRDDNRRAGAHRIEERERDRARDEKRGSSGLRGSFRRDSDKGGLRGKKFERDGDEKSKRVARDGFRKISYEGDRKASVVKKNK